MTKKKKKQKLQLIDYFIIVCLALLAFCILFLIFDKDDKKEVVDESIVVSENEKVGFKLNGKENLVIKKGSKYTEKGFAAFSSLEDDISEYVTVSGNVDTSEAGIYKIYYTLEYKTINKTLERTVEVVDKYSIMIKGDPVIYVLKDTEYKDLGVEVTAGDGSKLEHEVEIDNKVDTSKEGDYYITYKVTYEDEEKELMRKVVVYTLDYTITVDNTENTAEKVVVTFNTESPYYAYSLYNDKKTSLKQYNVDVYSNMTVNYKIYDIFGNVINKDIEIKNIKKVVLTGTCSALVEDNKTTFNVTSSKTISNIEYYGAGIRIASDKNTSYVYNGKLNPKSSVSVKIYDTDNKVITVDCKVTDKTTSTPSPSPSTKPSSSPSSSSGGNNTSSSSVVFSSNSDTMKVTITKNSSYYITKVWMSNPNKQINKFDSPEYGSNLYKPSNLLSKAVSAYNLTGKTLVGFNASGFYLKDTYDAASVSKYPAFDKTSVGTIVITNGQVVRNAYTKAYKTWYTLGVDSSNTLRIFTDKAASTEQELSEKKTWADSVINSGIRNTFTFAGPLVVNGQASSTTTSFPSASSKLNRQAICQVDSNNFVLITGSSLNRDDLINIMLNLNCKTGANLDGGGSIALIYKEKNSNEIKKVIGDSRSLTEVGYFSD